MSLVGTTNEEKIWNYLKASGLSACGVAGLMGNLYAESELRPNNLENGCEERLGYTDATYTAAVDSGSYANFAKDGAGYGLAQWTYSTRKAELFAFAKNQLTSIGDLEMQLKFLLRELAGNYPTVMNTLRMIDSVRIASDIVLLKFEQPADQSEAVKVKRAGYGQIYYDKYAKEDTMNEQELRAKAVSTACGWLGCRESDGSHKKIIDIYNGHKPLARGYKVQYTDAWCATFGSAVAIQLGLTDIIPTECSCTKMVELFKKLGSWQENDAYVPSPGDYIFYDWDDSGVGDNIGAPDHVGIVEKVVGRTITVIEGNYSDSVKRRTIQVNGRYIRGYGVPKYSSKANAPALEAIDKLAKLGVINSPDYWKQAVESGKVQYLDTLLIKAAAKITKAGTRSSTAENGIGALVAAGIINTPDYWLEHCRDYPSLDSLLCALGGAAR